MSGVALLAAAHGVTTAQDVSIGHVLLQMVVALGVVIGGIWGFGKIVRRAPRSRRSGTAGRGRGLEHGLRVLSRQAVGKGKSIAVVQAGEQCFLVGIADSGLTPLGELKRSDEVPPAESGIGAPPERPSARPGRRTGTGGVALEPFDLGSLDLSALAGAAAGGDEGPVPAGAAPAASAGRVASAGELPTGRGWLDALREATVRR